MGGQKARNQYPMCCATAHCWGHWPAHASVASDVFTTHYMRFSGSMRCSEELPRQSAIKRIWTAAMSSDLLVPRSSHPRVRHGVTLTEIGDACRRFHHLEVGGTRIYSRTSQNNIVTYTPVATTKVSLLIPSHISRVTHRLQMYEMAFSIWSA